MEDQPNNSKLIDLLSLKSSAAFGGGLKGVVKGFFYDHKYHWGFRHWNKFYWKLHDLIFPKQDWLFKSVENSWQDKPELLITVLSNFVVDFVEGERAFEVVNWESNDLNGRLNTKMAEAAAAIKACYEFIKNERPVLVKAIERIEHEGAYGREGELRKIEDWGKRANNMTYEEMYPGLIALETKLEELETMHFTNIIKYRGFLWT